jgi:hypothetical protein
MTRLRTKLATALLICLSTPVAHAALITWTFTGVVRDSVNAPIPPGLSSLGVAIGAPVTGFVEFESSTPAVNPSDPTVANYSGAVVNAAVSVGTWSLAIDPAGLFNQAVVSNTAGAPGEFLSANMLDPGGIASAPYLALELSKHGATLWPGKAMLLTPPALSALDPYGADPTSAWGFGTDVAIFDGAGMELHAQLTSLVPEPEIAALMAMCALALGIRGAIRHRL